MNNRKIYNQMEPQQVPRGKRMPTQYLFLINGIASLLGYNAVLTSLDYFNYVYQGYNVYSLFLPPVFAGYVIIVVSFKFLTQKFTYKQLVTSGIIICNVALIITLILSLTCHQAKGFGFAVTLFCCFLLGAGANLYQLTFFAEINYLSQSVVSKFTIGTAVGGLGITTLRMIIVSIAGTDDSLSAPIIIYFIIAILFNIFTLFSNLSFFKSRQYKLKILTFVNQQKQNKGDDATQILTVSSQFNDDVPNQQLQLQRTKSLDPAANESLKSMSYARILYNTAKCTFPYPILIFGNYIITFLVFPNLTINKKYDNLDFVWSSLIFFFMYNLGDTVGKFVCDYRWTFNGESVIYMFASRAYFLVAIPLMATKVLNDDVLINNYIYPYLVQFLFALTNGILTNACFIQSYQICPIKYKKYAGVLGGIVLQIGILVGTNLAIPFSSLFISSSD